MATTAKASRPEVNLAQPFELRIERLKDNEIALEVWQYPLSSGGRDAVQAHKVARVAGLPLHIAWDHLILALRRAGLRSGDLSPARRDRRMMLPEEVGVRVALLSAAVAPLRKLGRVERVAAGVSAMSYEEACYWYALARSDFGGRALRALRLLLAEE